MSEEIIIVRWGPGDETLVAGSADGTVFVARRGADGCFTSLHPLWSLAEVTERPVDLKAMVLLPGQPARFLFTLSGSEPLVVWNIADSSTEELGFRSDPAVRQPIAVNNARGIIAVPIYRYDGLVLRAIIHVMDADQMKVIQTCSHPYFETIYSMDFSPDGAALLVNPGGRELYVVDVNSGDITSHKIVGINCISSALFHPNGDTVIVGGWDGTLMLMDSSTWKPVRFGRGPLASPLVGGIRWQGGPKCRKSAR